MEKAIEKMVATSDAISVATMSMVINKFAQEVNVKPDSVTHRYKLVTSWSDATISAGLL